MLSQSELLSTMLAVVEGRANSSDGLQTKIVLRSTEAYALDTVIEGTEGMNDVNGTTVTAGYFVTDKNSKGSRNIIYFATFDLGEVVYYLELGDEESKGEERKAEITTVIENGSPALSQITK